MQCASEKEAVDTHTPTSNMKLCMYTKPDEQYVTKRRIRCLVHTLTSSSLPHSTNLNSSLTCQHQDLNPPLPNIGCKKLRVRCKTQLLLKLMSFLKRGRTICPFIDKQQTTVGDGLGKVSKTPGTETFRGGGGVPPFPLTFFR